MARIQVYVPDDLYRRVRPFIRRRAFSVSALLRPLLEAKVGEMEKEYEKQKKAKVKRGSPG